MKTFSIPEYGIIIMVTDGGAARIESKLKDQLLDLDISCNDCHAEAMVNAIESLILGHAVAGIDITSKPYLEGLHSCVAACINNL